MATKPLKLQKESGNKDQVRGDFQRIEKWARDNAPGGGLPDGTPPAILVLPVGGDPFWLTGTPVPGAWVLNSIGSPPVLTVQFIPVPDVDQDYLLGYEGTGDKLIKWRQTAPFVCPT